MDPPAFLPLTDLAFNILVILKDEDMHGYALLKRLRSRTGRESLRTGTVYAALARLQDQGLVGAAEEQPSDPGDDQRRRYYRVTALGEEVARAEARRLQELLGLARGKDLLQHGGA